MKVKYVGPYAEVEVRLPSGVLTAEKDGKPIDVPDDIGKGLLVQEDIWVAAHASAKKTKEAE